MPTSRKPEKAFASLVAVMSRLRGPGGCPWDRKQDHRSLKPYLLEETYEVLDAIDSGKPMRLAEELGDLLLQIVFHARMAEEAKTFDIRQVVDQIVDKMQRRHPHVFGPGKTLKDPHRALNQWYRIKHREQRRKGLRMLLHNIPGAMPSLQRAQKLQRKAASVHFDWPSMRGVQEKLREELRELEIAMRSRGPKRRERAAEELGDVLFTLVNLARWEKIDAEQALRAANNKFTKRFHAVELALRRKGKTLEESSLAEMERLWNRAKKKE